MESLRSWQANVLEDCVYASVDLLLETTIALVVHDSEVGMANPRIDELLVRDNGLLCCLIPCFVVNIGIELGCTSCSCNHMHDCFVASVPQLNCAPRSLIEEGLPDFVSSEAPPIHDTSVAKNHRLLFGIDCCL